MAEFKNKFSLSDSQLNTFSQCPRKWWFSRYGSWGGWEKNADPRTREVYRLKNLSGIYLWTGNRVHEALKKTITTWVETGVCPDEEIVVQEFLETLRREYRDSKNHPAGESFPKGFVKLIEHDDPDRAISDEKFKEVVDRAVASIRGFYKTSVYQKLAKLSPEERREAVLRKDDVLETVEIEIDGRKIPVYVTLDLAIKTNAGSLFIVDWKTGKPSQKHEDQLGLYVLFSSRKLGFSPEETAFAPIYLAYEPESSDYVVATTALVEDAERRLVVEGGKILSKVKDPENGVAEEENFEPIPKKGLFGCGGCEFRRVCPAAK